MKIGLWRYQSLDGQREAVVIANDKSMAYDSLPLAMYANMFDLVSWIGETGQEVEDCRVVLDAPIK